MPAKNLIEKIQHSIIRQFPEYADVKPEVKTARIEPQISIFQKLSMGVPKRRVTVYKMRFKKRVKTEDNTLLNRVLCVTFNAGGDILKITETK